MKSFYLSLFCALIFTTNANAHWGHLGEVAGHAHWLGLGAVVVAAGLAGLVGKLSDKDEEKEEEIEPEEVEGQSA